MSEKRLPKVEALLEEWEPRLREAFLAGIYSIRDAAQIAAIVARLERGDIAGAVDALGIDPARFALLDSAITAAFAAGGHQTANAIPALRLPDGGLVKIVFNIRNLSAERWLRNESSERIREIEEDARAMARDHLTAGMEQGNNPRSTAIELIGRVDPRTGRREGGMIGLTKRQGKWVRNYQAELEQLNPNALQRSLRDARFDKTVTKAIARGEPIPAAKIEDIVRAYKNRALRYRGENIARTESLRALNQSQVEATNQAIERGQVDSSAVTKVWVATKDRRTRDTHRALDGKEVPHNGRFQTASGPLEYPGDPNGPASETVNCRCTIRYKIDFLRGIR
jgi:hypothetical protein